MSNITLATTRFNEITRRENENYRRKKCYSGCIYGSPVKISNKIPESNILYVFEMDISPNIKNIIGIGMIENKLERNIHCLIYEKPIYNKYIYYSKQRIDIDDMSSEELEFMEKIRYALFKTKAHLQRSIGITQIPEKNLKSISLTQSKVVNTISEMFNKRTKETI